MQVTVGSLLGRSFSTTLKGFPIFVIVALIFNVPNFLVDYLVVPKLSPRVGGVVTSVADMLFGGLVTAGILHGVIEILRNRKPSIGACMQTAFKHFVPVVAISFLYGIAVAIGMLLLIIPGIIIACVWYVAVPAHVAEKTGVGGAFSRSAELTRGHRMTLFLTALVFGLITVGLMLAVVTPMTVASVDMEAIAAGETPSSGVSIVPYIIMFAMALTIGLWSQVAMGVAYHDLRANKEGLDTDQLAEVFA